MIIVTVNTRGTVKAENGVERGSFRYWPDRLEELTNEDYEIVNCSIDAEKGITTYFLQKVTAKNEVYEHFSFFESIEAKEDMLNRLGLAQWRLKTSVYYEIGGRKLVKHFMEREKK